jgi:hypothetical protein
MSKTKSAPGPWRLARLAKHGHPVRILAEDQTVAYIPEDDTLETKTGRIVEFVSPRGEANARLIACSPDLFELAQDTQELQYQVIDALKRVPGTEDLRRALHELGERAQTVLQKVSGTTGENQ